MIIKTSFRRAGDLGSHLNRSDTNERVEVLAEHCVGVEPDIHSALQLFAAIGNAFGIERSMIHTVIAPSERISGDELAASITEFRFQYGLKPDHMMIVVRHTKPGRTGRPEHVHIVAPRKHPASGIAIGDSWSRRRDEKIARILEAEFGHPLTSGRFNRSIAGELKTSHPKLARLLLNLEPPAHIAFDRRAQQQAQTCSVDPGEFDRRVYTAWAVTERDGKPFESYSSKAGLSLVQGDKVIMILDERTGFSQPLARLLRREGKRQAKRIEIKEAYLRALYPNLPPLRQARAEALQESDANIQGEVGREFTRAIADAVIAGDARTVKRLRNEKDGYKRRRDEYLEKKATLAAQREAIWAGYRLRNKIRQARIERVLAAGRARRSKIDLKAVFGLAAGGAVLAGFSFGASIAIGSALALVLARRRAAASLVERPAAAIAAVRAERAIDLQATRAASRSLRKAPLNNYNYKQGRNRGIGIG